MALHSGLSYCSLGTFRDSRRCSGPRGDPRVTRHCKLSIGFTSQFSQLTS